MEPRATKGPAVRAPRWGRRAGTPWPDLHRCSGPCVQWKPGPGCRGRRGPGTLCTLEGDPPQGNQGLTTWPASPQPRSGRTVQDSEPYKTRPRQPGQLGLQVCLWNTKGMVYCAGCRLTRGEMRIVVSHTPRGAFSTHNDLQSITLSWSPSTRPSPTSRLLLSQAQGTRDLSSGCCESPPDMAPARASSAKQHWARLSL